MTATLTTSSSLDQIEALLNRLDPKIEGICDVAGCIHHHKHHQSQNAAVEVRTV